METYLQLLKHYFYFIPFAFIVVWVLITFIISRMGWADLVQSYKYESKFIGQRVGFITAFINKVQYKNALILRYNAEGIYLEPIFLFRLFHPPILVPWTEITEVRNKRIFFIDFKELVIGHSTITRIRLYQSTFAKIEKELSLHSNVVR
jgi:hypothetical protein